LPSPPALGAKEVLYIFRISRPPELCSNAYSSSGTPKLLFLVLSSFCLFSLLLARLVPGIMSYKFSDTENVFEILVKMF
jgi:hypothetical protein